MLDWNSGRLPVIFEMSPGVISLSDLFGLVEFMLSSSNDFHRYFVMLKRKVFFSWPEFASGTIF